MADQTERVILEAEKTPVLESVGRANTALDSARRNPKSRHGKVVQIHRTA
jgi:myosin heavy subunit